jgi:DeoR/GlpR family transcriptional regulator of sugar metabolism
MVTLQGSQNLSGVERQDRIVDILGEQGRISINNICDLFAISEATARRDLETLTVQGRVRRVHGGATRIKQKAPPEMPFLQREAEQPDEKKRIGQAAAALVKDGETVFLGSGSTVLEVARNMRQLFDLTIITNSLPVMNTLADVQSISLIALGGLLRQSELSFIGHITEQALAEVHANKVFMGMRAIDVEEGLSNHYLPETLTDRAIIKAGSEIIVVADHTKFGRVAAARLAPIEAVHTIVTDTATPTQVCKVLEGHGIHVIVV